MTLKLALIGYGAIAKQIVQSLEGLPCEIVAIAMREPRVGVPHLITTREQLLEAKPDLVVEAAGQAAVHFWGEVALQAAPAFAIASTSALVDYALMARLVKAAETHHSQILIPPGALGAVDALAAASLLPLKRVTHTIIKPCKAWEGTAAEKLVDLKNLREATSFFKGTAREAATIFPQNANVTVISSLAGVGLEKTKVQLIADPFAKYNAHKLLAEGDFGRMRFVIENLPSQSNPKTSLLTALSLVRLIKNRFARVVV